MPKTASPGTREQKLAQKLRENLKRRKIQKRQRNIVRPEHTPNKPKAAHSEKTAKSDAK